MRPSSRLQQAAARFRAAQDGRYEQQRYTTLANVTAVTKDDSGRVVAATATIDGATGQTVQLPYGSAVGVGSVLLVTNQAQRVRPVWVAGSTAQGAPAGAVQWIVGPGGEPIITPAGISLGEANLLRNSDFSQTRRGHRNQPVGWVSNSLAVILTTVGEE